MSSVYQGNRENTAALKIKGCNAKHLFVYEPNSKSVLNRAFQNYLKIDFMETEANQDDGKLDDDNLD